MQFGPKHVKNILRSYFTPAQRIELSRSYLNILCDGDCTGVITEENLLVYTRGDQTKAHSIFRAVSLLATALATNNQCVEAEAALRSVHAAIARYGDSDLLKYDVLEVRAAVGNNLGLIYHTMNRRNDVLKVLQTTIAQTAAAPALGPEHVWMASSLCNYGAVLTALTVTVTFVMAILRNIRQNRRWK